MNSSLPLPPPQHLFDEQRETMRRALVQYAADHDPRQAGRRRRARMILAGGLGFGVVVAGGVAVAANFLGSEPVRNHDTARCYSRISTDFGSHFPGASIASVDSPDGKPGQVTAPIEACADAWRVGAIQYPNPYKTPPPAKELPVPHLVGCVLPDGTAAVFPGPDGTCERLGLPTALPG